MSLSSYLKRKLREWLKEEQAVAPLGVQEVAPAPTPPIPPVEDARGKDWDLFQPEERCIFKYFDGSTTLMQVDPILVYRRMMEVGPALSIDMSVSRSLSKDASKAYVAMIEKMRNIFDVKPFSEGGLLDSEVIMLFDKFNTFCDVIQKKTKNSATSPTETSPTSAPSTAENPPSTSGSASGSTANAPSTDVPPPSTTGPA